MTYRFDSLPLVLEGKTKIVRRTGNGLVHIKEKNDMTAGNGKRHALVPGKGKICAAITARLFRFLEEHDVPHALDAEVVPGINSMREVRMRPYEVVGRFKADGSYCKRHPEVPKGTPLDHPKVEFYLKLIR